MRHRRGKEKGISLRHSLMGLSVGAMALTGVSAEAQNRPPVPAGSPLPRVAPPVLPSTAPATEAPLLPPPGSEVPNAAVKVTSTVIEGATIYTQADLAGSAEGLIGPATPLPKIDAARLAILQRYRSAGFTLTTVSVKLDAAGHLRFIVTEGRIAAVKLDGDIGPAGVQVLRFLNRLTETTPIDSKTLERYLLLAQDVPGVTVRAVLQPSADQPGALTLVAQVSRKAVGGSLSVDNRAFTQTGPYQALATIDINSFTSLGERTQVSYYHTFLDSQNFGQVSEEFFIGSSGLKVKIYAGYGQVNPDRDGSLARGGYRGTTTVFGGQASYPIIRTRQQNLSVYGAFDALESQIQTGIPLVRSSFDSLRVVRLGGDYVLSDAWLGGAYPAINTVSVRGSQGLRILGASTTGTAQSSPRQHERSDFTKANFEVSREQTLYTINDTTSVSLLALVTGQWSGDILPSAEQFYLGGPRFTRGYYSGQVPGDKALAATAELRLNTSFNLPSIRDDGDVATQFYVFYDWGETWQNVAADFATKVATAGGGARVQITSWAEVDVEALGRFNAYPTGGQGTGVSPLHGLGLYWRVLGHF